jgi:cytochrome c oxidase subunit 2
VRAPPRLRAGLLLAAAAAVATACGGPAPSALNPKGPAAERIASVWWIMFGLAAAVYVVVGGLIVAAAVRKPETEGDEGRRLRISDNHFIWVGGIIVPTIILGILAVVTVQSTRVLAKAQPDALHITVTGYRWWWEVRYPNEGIVTANEIRIPAGRPIELALESIDVIHSFWVPQLAGKGDLVPGQRNVLRLQADQPGEYRGQCAEYCGAQHAKMAFLVIAEPAADFERWVARQQRPPSTPASELEAIGQVVFNRSTCVACHTIRGTEARGEGGPDLTDFGSRRTLGAVALPNTRANLAGWIVDSQSIKPENLMPPVYLEADELNALVEYLENRR